MVWLKREGDRSLLYICNYAWLTAEGCTIDDYCLQKDKMWNVQQLFESNLTSNLKVGQLHLESEEALKQAMKQQAGCLHITD